MLKRIWTLIRSSFRIWNEAHSSRMSAAMAYYAILSLAPLLMIAITVAGYVFEDGLVQSEIVKLFERFTTQSVAETVGALIKNATQQHQQRPRTGLMVGALSLLVLVYGAAGVFAQLHDTFNEIWKIPFEMRKGFWFNIHKRFIGIAMVLSTGILLMSAILLDNAMEFVNDQFHEDYSTVVSYLHLMHKSITYLVIPVALAFMYWLIPATRVEWKDVWLAAIIAAVMISFCRYLIAIYLKFSSTQVVYGSAGSLVVLLIWVYMTGLAVFYGAAFSHAWADTFGSRKPEVDRPRTGDHSQSELPGVEPHTRK